MSLLDALLSLWAALNTALVLWALGRTRRLESTMNTRLDTIDRKLDSLPTKQDIVNANQETMSLLLLSLGLRPPPITSIGSVQTGGGGAAVGGSVTDSRKPQE